MHTTTTTLASSAIFPPAVLASSAHTGLAIVPLGHDEVLNARVRCTEFSIAPARSGSLVPSDTDAEPGRCIRALLDRYEPDPAYFACSASAAQIARTRGTGRLTYDAV